MKLPLGLLLEECMPDCVYPPYIQPDNLWLSDISLFDPYQESRKDTLYIALDDRAFPEYYPEKDRQNILVIAHPDTARCLEKSFCLLTIPDSQNLIQLAGRLQDLFREFQDWYLRVTDACSFGCHLQELINLTESMTPNHIYIADMSFKILAYTDKKIMAEISATWRYQLAHGYLPVHVMKGMIESREFEQLNGFRVARHFYSKNFYVPFVTKNIFYNNRPQAHLFVVNAIKRPCSRDLAVAQLLGEFLEKHYFILSEYKLNRTGNNHEAFFGDVLRGNCRDETVIARQISLFDWTMEETYCMAVIDVSARDDGFRKIIMYQIEEGTDYKCFIYDDYLIVLQNAPNQKRLFLKKILRRVFEQHNLEICLGSPYREFLQLKEQYRFLRRIMEIARQYHGGQQFYEASNYGIFYIIDHINTTPQLYRLCNWDVSSLKQYDREHDTAYFHTYFTYLLHDRNVVRTAKELHIHRNTLMYRLEKIHGLITTDEEKPEQKLHLLLSMMMLRHKETCGAPE